MQDLLTAKELKEVLKIKNIQTIYDWRQKGLPCKISKPLRFDLEDVIEWLNSRSDEK